MTKRVSELWHSPRHYLHKQILVLDHIPNLSLADFLEVELVLVFSYTLLGRLTSTASITARSFRTLCVLHADVLPRKSSYPMARHDHPSRIRDASLSACSSKRRHMMASELTFLLKGLERTQLDWALRLSCLLESEQQPSSHLQIELERTSSIWK